MFERRKQVFDAAWSGLKADLTDNVKLHRLLACNPDGGEEFARMTIESEDMVAGGKPQHMGQVMALVAVERDALAHYKWPRNMKSRGPEVVFRHRPFPFVQQPLKKPESGANLSVLRPGLS
jgi:hypothetical protein